MAAAALRHGIVWLAPRSAGERALVTEPLPAVCPPGQQAAALRPERASLEALPRMRTVALVFDARDVTLLRARLPAISGARLARALPNLLEDRLLQDANGCAFALGPVLPDGERIVAVIDRGWLEFACGAFERRGLKVVAAWPAQLTLPMDSGAEAMLACVGDSVVARRGPFDALGWNAGAEAGDRLESLLGMLPLLQPGGKPSAVVARVADASWQGCIDDAAERLGWTISLQPWAIDVNCPIDLLSARQGGPGRRRLAAIDWSAWRVPAAIAAAAGVVATAGLNLHWLQLERERDALRQRMEATFRESFPQAQVVVDPLLQMRRLVADQRALAGRSAPDDFLPLLGRLAMALGADGVDALAAIEYRDARLKVRWRNPVADPAARERLAGAAARAGLSLRFEADGSAVIALTGQA
jgi:general secretion pathway protein L